MNRNEFYTLPQPVRNYLNYLDSVKNKSELTVLEYASDLRLFFRFLMFRRGLAAPALPLEEINISNIDIDFISAVTLMDAYDFLSYCKNTRKNEAAARARKSISIKRFYRYLEINKFIESNPLRELESPKKRKSLPKYLTLEQSIKLLESVDGKNKERDYCILTLFLNCGMRLSELVSINLSDFSDNNTLTVLGKGDKERTIYLNNACLSAVKAYMAVRPVDGVKDRDALFISSQKRRISPKTVQKMVEYYLEKAGLGGMGFSVHKLRHTAATLMYQHGNVDVLLIKEILGHENLATTEIYTHVVNTQLREAVDANPLNSVIKKDTSKSEE